MTNIETPAPTEPSAEAFKTLLCGTEAVPGILDKLNMSIEQFARACNLTRASVYYYIHSTTRPTPNTLARMANVLGISYEEALKHITPRHTGRQRKEETVVQ